MATYCKRILNSLVMIGVLANSAAPASAQACSSNATQSQLNACSLADLKTADAALNGAYREIMARLVDDPDARTRLQASQRAWIGFRDAECAFAASAVEGGSAYPMIHAICLAGLTSARVEQLDVYLNCEEGDLSCPVPAE